MVNSVTIKVFIEMNYRYNYMQVFKQKIQVHLKTCMYSTQ